MSVPVITKTADERRGPGRAAAPRPARRRLLAALAAVGLAVAAGRLLWLSPPGEEWRLSRASLPALLRERGRHTDDPRLLYYVGLRLDRRGRSAEAETNLRAAVGLDPDDPRLRDEWARAQVASGQVTAAFGQLREFAGTHPDSAPAHRLLGRLYASEQSMARAAEEFGRAVALDPRDDAAWAGLAEAGDALGDPDPPVAAARRAVSLVPRRADYHLLLADLLDRRGRPDAGAEYRRAIALAPRRAVAHAEYARWLVADAAGTAEAEARRALALGAPTAGAYLTLGQALRDQGRVAEAAAPLAQAAALDPDDPAPARALASVSRALGRASDARRWDAEAARRQAEKADRDAVYQLLRAHPDSRPLHARMARLRARHGDVDGCLRDEAAAHSRPVDSVQALDAAARDLTAGGHPDLALPLARRAVALGPLSPANREALGDALLHTGYLDEAINDYNYVTNYEPSRAPALQARVDRWAAAHPAPLSPAHAAYSEALALMDDQIGLRRTPLRAEPLAAKAVALDPGAIEYRRLLLRIQFGAREMRAAAATARDLLRLAPGDAPTHALLAVLLADGAAGPVSAAAVQAHVGAAAADPATAPQRHYALGLLALHRRDGAGAAAELRRAAALDPGPDVTYYKIALAERLAGHARAADEALAVYERRRQAKLAEFTLQSDISAHPGDPTRYAALIAFYRAHGRTADARAVRAALARRFPATSKETHP